jgi:hypothetical protein
MWGTLFLYVSIRTGLINLLQNDMAKPSNSSWSSSCILVPKPDGRRVNAVTKSDSFPLPRLDDCIDRIGSAAYVSKLDLLKGYWQVLLTYRLLLRQITLYNTL